MTRTTMANFTTTSELPIGVLACLSAFNIVLSFTAFLGNVLILVAIRKVSSLHPAAKLLFRCLAVTDLCVGLFPQPLFVADLFYNFDFKYINQDSMYYVGEGVYISSYILCGVSVLISTAISVDRLLALSLGLRYRLVVTLRRVRAVVVFSWLTAISCGLVRLWSYPISEGVVFVAGMVSLLISVFCYVKINLRLRQHQAQVQDHSNKRQSNSGERGVAEAGEPGRAEEEGGEGAGGARGEGGKRFDGRIQLNIAQYKKTVSSISWVQLALVACYTPFIIVSLLYNIMPDEMTIHALWLFTATLVYLNSSLNPILYCWKIRDVRIAVKDTVRHFFCCL